MYNIKIIPQSQRDLDKLDEEWSPEKVSNKKIYILLNHSLRG